MWVRNGEWDSFSKQRDDSIKLCSVESSNNWRYRSDSSYRNYYFKQGPMGHYIDPHHKNGKSILILESNNLCASKYQRNLSIESFDLLWTDSISSFCFCFYRRNWLLISELTFLSAKSTNCWYLFRRLFSTLEYLTDSSPNPLTASEILLSHPPISLKR